MSEVFRFFDSHLHIIDPGFPLIPNQGYLPDSFTVDAYLNRIRDHQLMGGAVVSGSFQGFDQTYLIAALKALGEGFVGVTQLPSSVTDEEILHLDTCGVRALRFNLKRGGSEGIQHLEAMACRIYELAGWHVELYVDSSELGELMPVLESLPLVSIDHLGLSKQGLPDIIRLAESGIRIKATGFGRLDFKPVQAVKDIYKSNPQALMFGTDLPGTRAPEIWSEDDAALICDTLGDIAAENVLFRNALRFYRLPSED